MNPSSNLFFVGPMGAGKTTIGRRVAQLLGMHFYDLDQEIEQRCGASISLIFELEGEKGFRQRESGLLRELATNSNLVLSTGGGAILRAENREVLRNQGFVVYLQLDVELQLLRLSRDRKRPLLPNSQAETSATIERQEYLQVLATERSPLYCETADLVVPAETVHSATHMASRVTDLLHHRWQRSTPLQIT